MLTHFQFERLYNIESLTGWKFSFYFEKQRYTGLYHGDGKIEWASPTPPIDNDAELKKMIHELMLFHVYDQ